jgi:hypothetical protein
LKTVLEHNENIWSSSCREVLRMTIMPGARKLLIAPRRYLESGLVPDRVVLKNR